MARNKVRVGVVGANPARGWFVGGHLPALAALGDHFEISAVCTSRPETAAQAKALTGARWAFSDFLNLVQCEDVDLVVVTVKTQFHHAIVSAAIDAGKDVFCEWPLGRTVQEAQALAAQAGRAGVRHVIGLQARMAPAVITARQLIRDGYIGNLLSTSIVASAPNWGGYTDPDGVYGFDAQSGSSMPSISGGHLLDALCHVCGEFDSLSAQVSTRRQRVAVVDPASLQSLRRYSAQLRPEEAPATAPLVDDLVHPRSWFTPTSPDQLAVQGVLECGVVASVHLRGGQHRGRSLVWDLNGDEGDLQITATGGSVQIVGLTLQGGRGRTATLETLPYSADLRASSNAEPPGPASNIWHLYLAYLGENTSPDIGVADFHAAADRQDLLAVVEQSAHEGRRLGGLG